MHSAGKSFRVQIDPLSTGQIAGLQSASYILGAGPSEMQLSATYPETQDKAMCDLAAALSAASAGLAGWKCSGGVPSPLQLCAWYGLTCDGSNSVVTGINLYPKQLTGSLPTSIGSLTFLNSMQVTLNKLAGTVPTSVGAMKSLTLLHLGYNKLTGVLPSTLCSLPLKNVYLLKSGLSCYPGCLSTVSTLTATGLGPCTFSPTGKQTCLCLQSNSCNDSFPLST